VSDIHGVVSRAKELARVAGRPVVAKLRPRIENIALDRIRPELDAVHADIAALRGEVERATQELDGHVKWLYDEQRRLAPHLAALEARVAAFERPGSMAKLTERLEFSPDEADEVRAEHARIRARLAAISKYEERLARLEEDFAARREVTG
jgi:predicted  nucleic acid-binding Zn-ribbon protein